jgi:hypothetical protein
VFDADARTHLLPMHLLLKSDYSIAPELAELKPPVLVLCSSGTQQGKQYAKEVLAHVHGAKSLLTMPDGGNPLGFVKPVDDFLDSVLTAPANSASATPKDSGSGSAPAQSQGK